jgi:hypothetical protein
MAYVVKKSRSLDVGCRWAGLDKDEPARELYEGGTRVRLLDRRTGIAIGAVYPDGPTEQRSFQRVLIDTSVRPSSPEGQDFPPDHCEIINL